MPTIDGTGAVVQKEDEVEMIEGQEVLSSGGAAASDETVAAIDIAVAEASASIPEEDIGVDEFPSVIEDGVDVEDLAAFQGEVTLRTKKLGIYEPPNIMAVNTRGTSASISDALDGSRFAPTIRLRDGPGREPVGYPTNAARFGRLTNVESSKFINPGFV